MFWYLVLPVCLILIVVLRIQYPSARKSFISSSFFFSLAVLLQFQNCSYLPADKASSNQEQVSDLPAPQ